MRHEHISPFELILSITKQKLRKTYETDVSFNKVCNYSSKIGSMEDFCIKYPFLTL